MNITPGDRRAVRDWEVYLNNFLFSVYAEQNESEADRHKRIQRLESDFEAWKVYYFPNYCYAAPAPFHVKASRRALDNQEWYETRAWSRELAKDVVTMIETLFQTLTGLKKNVIFVSNSWDKANELLTPFKLNLERNERIINDYGIQQLPGSWRDGDFITTQGVSFLAIGAGQSPRGSRNEEVRPDKVIISDIDTDEDCRNPETINNKWKWFEEALFPTRSVSKHFQVIWLGNVIAKDCCIVRAMKYSDHSEVINLEDRNGKPTWEKNLPENIARIKSKISTKAYQQEYMNNPIAEGSVFKELTWGVVPPLSKFKFLVSYGDPAPSNKTSKKGLIPNKALFLCGILDNNLYVITGYLDSVTNPAYVDWYYNIRDYVADKTQVYNYIENNSLQDPFYEQVFIPLFAAAAKTKGIMIPISPDNRKKPDKFSRVEGNLEPLNRAGRLILNAAEKGNPNMVRLEEQFKLVAPGLPAPIDGPDAVEGAFWQINEKMYAFAAGAITFVSAGKNPKRI